MLPPLQMPRLFAVKWRPKRPAWHVLGAAAVLVALSAFCGHLFPVWLGFKGGKGVATGLGIFLVLSPWAALAGIVTYAFAYGATRVSSVGSLAGTAVCTLGTFVAYGWRSPVAWAGLGLAALIVLRHRENIRRLVRGDEKRV
jgi:glycerol-3-phosphate acyltransferase PlsY